MNTKRGTEYVWAYSLPEHKSLSEPFRGKFSTRHEAIGYATKMSNGFDEDEWEVRCYEVICPEDDAPPDSSRGRKSYGDVAAVDELQAILDEVAEKYGGDVEVTVPRSDGFRVPTHPTLFIDSDGVDEWATLELAHDYS